MRKFLDFSNTEVINNRNRTYLTIGLVSLGLTIMLTFGVLMICLASQTDRPEFSKLVFNTTIPLIGTWIGTILAFHFGRENYEAATKHALALSKEVIEVLKVENIMIDVKTILYRKIEPSDYGKNKLSEIITFYKEAEKDRIPIFYNDLRPQLIIQRNLLEVYLTQKGPTASSLTLTDFINDHKNNFTFKNEGGFAVVSKSDSVKRAYNEMNLIKDCQDVFITDNGTDQGKVLGWLTNTLINRFLSIG